MKQTYVLHCPDCGHTKNFDTDNWYNFGDRYPDECCFKKVCPKCKSTKYERAPRLEEKGRAPGGVVKPGAHKLADNMKKQVREDITRMYKGDEKFIANVAGEKANPLLGKDIKYAKDVKNPKFKRRK